MTPLVAAAVQFAPRQGDVAANLNRARHLVNDAALAGAQLIVLPELCLAGTAFPSIREASMTSQRAEGPQTVAMAEIAIQTGTYVVFGYVEAANGAFYNSAMLIGPDGSLQNFRKHNLWGDDFFWATHVSEPRPVAVTPHGRIGVLIGQDLHNVSRKSLGTGEPFYPYGTVDIVCAPVSWNTQYEFPDSAWVGLAEELGCDVVVANRCGGPEESFRAGSCVIDRNMRVSVMGGSRSGPCIVGGELMTNAEGDLL